MVKARLGSTKGRVVARSAAPLPFREMVNECNKSWRLTVFARTSIRWKLMVMVARWAFSLYPFHFFLLAFIDWIYIALERVSCSTCPILGSSALLLLLHTSLQTTRVFMPSNFPLRCYVPTPLTNDNVDMLVRYQPPLITTSYRRLMKVSVSKVEK